jgi:hypothetical protein
VEKHGIPTAHLEIPLVTRTQGLDLLCHLKCSHIKILLSGVVFLADLAVLLSAFRTWGGSLDRRVKLSLRAPAQMGWHRMEHKRWDKPSIILHQGARSRGYKRREREEESRFVSPPSPLCESPSFRGKALDLPFIDARRGSRCTMGV